MRILLKVALSLALLAAALIGVGVTVLRAYGEGGPASLAGRETRSESRTVGAGIHKVELSGPINLTLRQGPKPSLQVHGEQRLLSNIETTQVGDTLRIGIKGVLLYHRIPLQAELVLPALEALDVRGGGDSTVNGFSGDQFTVQLNGPGSVVFNGRIRQLVGAVRGSGELDINGGNSDSVVLEMVGSGQITASGSSKTLTAALTGSGDVYARHLSADSSTVTVAGSGDARVCARDSVDLTLRGSGDIRVYGNPRQRNVSRVGTGEVKWD